MECAQNSADPRALQWRPAAEWTARRPRFVLRLLRHRFTSGGVQFGQPVHDDGPVLVVLAMLLTADDCVSHKNDSLDADTAIAVANVMTRMAIEPSTLKCSPRGLVLCDCRLKPPRQFREIVF